MLKPLASTHITQINSQNRWAALENGQKKKYQIITLN